MSRDQPREAEPRVRTVREIVAPLHETAPPEETDEECGRFVDELVRKVRQERRPGEPNQVNEVLGSELIES